MRSMTGYGSAVWHGESFEVSIEVFSVNKKNLDVSVQGPKEWITLEREILERVKSKLKRGRLTVQLRILENAATGGGFTINQREVLGALEELNGLSERVGVEFAVDTELLLQLSKLVGKDRDWELAEDSFNALADHVDSALDKLLLMREEEGKALKEDLLGRIELLGSYAERISEKAPEGINVYHEQLMKRLEQRDLGVDLNDERVLKEIALYADRSDISEEATRVSSHVEQFRDICNESNPVGRKLDFLCQELNREFNTMGSKSADIEITRIVLEAKNELERVREQVQNIE